MLLHAGDYCAPFSLRPIEEAQHVAGRRVRPERRRHAGPPRARAVRASASSCSSGRTASRSAGAAHPRRARHRRRPRAAVHRGHSIVVHGFTHQQEMKTRGDTLIVNPGEACGWLYGTPKAAILDLDDEAGRVPQPRPRALDDMTAVSRILIIDYGSQFTQLIARRVREARVYSEIHPPTRSRRVDSRLEADGHHPQRRTELRLRGERADGRSGAVRRRSGARRSATGCSSSRTCSGGEVIGGGTPRVRPRRDPPWTRVRLFDGFAERRRDARCG